MQEDLSHIRTDYQKLQLDETIMEKNPFLQFEKWMSEVIAGNVIEPNAMTISTVDANGKPSSRIVLLRGLTEKGFVFFTNYESKKATDLSLNPFVALNFFWPALERQVRVEGKVSKISYEESLAYFQSRPKESQISAWASPQSNKIENREVLEEKVKALEKQYSEEALLPKPDFWGGYLITPSYFEFWQGRANRLHDRLVFEFLENNWTIKRIAP